MRGMHFSLMNAFLSKLQVLPKHHKVAPSPSYTLLLCNKYIKQKPPLALALAAVLMFGLTILSVY